MILEAPVTKAFPSNARVSPKRKTDKDLPLGVGGRSKALIPLLLHW
jgi:hypothetical protein